MSVIRVRHDKSMPYLMVAKATVNDNRLSLAARGFLMVLLALPDHWQFNIRGLCKIAHVSKDTVTRHLNDLIASGYCKRTKLPKVGGRFPSTTRSSKTPSRLTLQDKPKSRTLPHQW